MKTVENIVTAHQRTPRKAAFRLRLVAQAVLGAFLAGAAAGVLAGPTGAEVSVGSGKISQAGPTVTVEQSSPRLSINWQGFSIGAGESVVFRQRQRLRAEPGHDPGGGWRLRGARGATGRQ
jgi:large exoprotein involved in heme utilization and adhesion